MESQLCQGFIKKDTVGEFTGSNGLGPKTETNEEAELELDANTNANAINKTCGFKSISGPLFYLRSLSLCTMYTIQNTLTHIVTHLSE